MLSLSAVHLKGELKQVADFLSRMKLRESDWVLSQVTYRMIIQKWGVPCVDLFTSRENAKTPLFFSLNRRDGAIGVDALS